VTLPQGAVPTDLQPLALRALEQLQ
jgi:hypothetical protein